MIDYAGEDPADMADAAARLAADLKRIVAGEAPTTVEFEAAPLLDGWIVAAWPRRVLAGGVHDHPLLGTRGLIRTSSSVAIDQERGWARTFSRWYRLGATADERAGGCRGSGRAQ